MELRLFCADLKDEVVSLREQIVKQKPTFANKAKAAQNSTSTHNLVTGSGDDADMMSMTMSTKPKETWNTVNPKNCQKELILMGVPSDPLKPDCKSDNKIIMEKLAEINLYAQENLEELNLEEIIKDDILSHERQYASWNKNLMPLTIRFRSRELVTKIRDVTDSMGLSPQEWRASRTQKQRRNYAAQRKKNKIDPKRAALNQNIKASRWRSSDQT